MALKLDGYFRKPNLLLLSVKVSFLPIVNSLRSFVLNLDLIHAYDIFLL